MALVLLVAMLFAQTSNPWDGTWQWHTYEERQAWTRQWMAEVHAIAVENCGKPYFGTVCE